MKLRWHRETFVREYIDSRWNELEKTTTSSDPVLEMSLDEGNTWEKVPLIDTIIDLRQNASKNS